jgi:hypothetical protein
MPTDHRYPANSLSLRVNKLESALVWFIEDLVQSFLRCDQHLHRVILFMYFEIESLLES